MFQRPTLKKPLRIGINGFGRIGRCLMRVLAQTPEFQNGQIVVTGINDLTDASTLAHLLEYDSVHGRLSIPVAADGNFLIVGGKKLPITAIPNPADLPWASTETDLVLECTGRLKDREATAAHLKAGAKRVLYSAPLKGADLTVVLGINHDQYDPSKHPIVSNASCTTNCLAPVVAVLDESFGVVSGTMLTVHSYTNDQRILDLPHSDMRRARAAAVSMIPTTTGAAKAVGLVLPHLKGKIDGLSIRVPTPNVSLVDFTATLKSAATVESVNKALQAASEGKLKGILDYTTKELVSVDFNGNAASATVDSSCTSVVESHLVKVLAWYDNEWGFSNRMIDMLYVMGSKA
jgi:glyceraldehyde 3-phosphate dehydrogenase